MENGSKDKETELKGPAIRHKYQQLFWDYEWIILYILYSSISCYINKDFNVVTRMYINKDFNVMGFPCGSDGKGSACKTKTQVWALGWEDPQEKEMAIHSSILA